jgi:hypothetical protein
MKKLSWRSLNAKLSTLSEDELYILLQAERVGERRLSVLERLHQRYNVLRVARERAELIKEAKEP